MAIYEKDLMASLAREVGDTDTSNLYYTPSQLFSAINDGLQDYNEMSITQQYKIEGSGESAYFSPDPDETDQRLIVLFSALALTRGEIQKAARTALVHSNPAGRTDTTRIPSALQEEAERLEKRIREILTQRQKRAVEKDLEDHGIRVLRSRDVTEPTYAEGTPITTITHGV